MGDVYQEALRLWGEDLQLLMAIEEMSELTKELIKDFRKKGNYNKIREEMADVEIMLTQLKLIYGDIRIVKDQKLGRLARVIEEKLKKEIKEEK